MISTLSGFRSWALIIGLCLFTALSNNALGQDNEKDWGEPISTWIDCSVHFMIKGALLKNEKDSNWAVLFLQGATGAALKKGETAEAVERTFKRRSAEFKDLIKKDPEAFKERVIVEIGKKCEAFIDKHAYEGDKAD